MKGYVKGRLAITNDVGSTTYDPFATEVNRLLGERGTSLRALARDARVDPSHLSRVLRGKKPPSANFIARVADALGVPVWHFHEYRAAVVATDPDETRRAYRRIMRKRRCQPPE